MDYICFYCDKSFEHCIKCNECSIIQCYTCNHSTSCLNCFCPISNHSQSSKSSQLFNSDTECNYDSDLDSILDSDEEWVERTFKQNDSSKMEYLKEEEKEEEIELDETIKNILRQRKEASINEYRNKLRNFFNQNNPNNINQEHTTIINPNNDILINYNLRSNQYSIHSSYFTSDDHVVNESNNIIDWNTLEVPCNFPLKNSGNSCYLNSVFQIFFHSKDLYQSFIKVFKPEPSTLDDLLILIKKYFTSYVKVNLNEQCDSEEFLTWCLDKMEHDNHLWKQKWHQYIKCKTCEFTSKSVKEECFWLCTIDEDDIESLYVNDNNLIDFVDYLESLADKEESCEYKCEKCTCTSFTKCSVPVRCSKHLFFNISETKLHFELEPEITIFHDDEPYLLKGAIIHSGSLLYGHYTFYYFNTDLDSDECIYFNDHIVTTCSKEKILESTFQNSRTTIRCLWYEKMSKKDYQNHLTIKEQIKNKDEQLDEQ